MYAISMTSPETQRRSLLRMLGERLIPLAARNNTPPVLLMEPANLARQQFQFSLHSGTPLQDSKRLRSPLYLHQWNELQLHAVRYPCLAAVVEGEVDWRIGITQSALERRGADWKKNDYLVISLAEGTFFLMPPGVPYSTGQGVHWERPIPRNGAAILFWMLILPSGFMCHYCRSTGTGHQSHPQFFVPSHQVHQLTKMLEDELKSEYPGSDAIARAHLQAILGYASRGLQSQTPINPTKTETVLQDVTGEISALPQDAVQRAQAYIESHLQTPLTPAVIAAQAYLSVRQLDRYFQRDFEMSVADYVAQRRVEMAKVLLQDTDLPVSQIGQIVGYNNPSSFTQIFKRREGVSPQNSRQRNKKSTFIPKKSV
jgi:AraC-like DNA-binding protein